MSFHSFKYNSAIFFAILSVIFSTTLVLFGHSASAKTESKFDEIFEKIEFLKTSNPEASSKLLDQLEAQLEELNDVERYSYNFFRAHRQVVIGQFKEAEQQLTEVIESAPLLKQKARAHSLLANVALLMGNYDQAFSNAQLALDLLPKIEGTQTDNFRFGILQNIANLFKQSGVLGKSMEYSNQLLKAAGDNPAKECISHIEMGNWYILTSQLDMMESRIERAKDACKKTDDSLFYAFFVEVEARFLMSSGKLKEAEELLLNYNKFENFNGYFLLPIIFNTALANVYELKKDTDNAIKYALQAYKVASEYNDVTRLKENTRILAEQYSQKGELNLSIKYYREHLELEKQLELQTNQRKLAYFNMSLRD